MTFLRSRYTHRKPPSDPGTLPAYLNVEVQNIERAIPWNIGADSRDSTATGNGRTDDTSALAKAQTQADGDLFVIGPGTYRLASDFDLTGPTWLMPGAVLKPDSGKAVNGDPFLIDTYSQIFDPSAGGTFGLQFANRGIRGEWFGGVNVLPGVVNNSLGVGNSLAFTAALGCLNGNTLIVTNEYILATGVGPPPNNSFTIEGSAPTGCGFRATTTSPTITLLSLAGLSAPAKRIVGIKLENPDLGVVGGIGLNLVGTNGLWVTNCWFGGMAQGVHQAGSFCSFTDCTAEFCTKGVVFDTNAPDESQHRGWTFYSNGNDITATGVDMSNTLIDGMTSFGCTGTSVVVNTAPGFSITNSRVQDAATDMSATGVDVVYVNGCAINVDSLIAAGVLVGDRVGKKQRTFWTSAKPTTTAVQFYQGDRAQLYHPTAGNVAGWTNVADSSVGVNAGNWRDEAAIS